MKPDISLSSALDEETARAEVYGLLAALYYAPPTPEMLAQLRAAATEAPAAGGFLEEPWRDLVALTKPRIIALLQLTPLVPMFLAGPQAPSGACCGTSASWCRWPT